VVLDTHPDFNLHHTCDPLPNFAITATGLVLIRHEKDLSLAEKEFLQGQFSNIGLTPRAMQYNFARHFKDVRRKPTRDLLKKMKNHYSSARFGLDDANVKHLLRAIQEHEAKGGVGRIEHDLDFR